MNGQERFAQDVMGQVTQKMYGLDEVIQLCLIALFTEGHILLEGNPGLGKTELVKALAEVLNLPWNRIQFTPDLMPSDVTGTYMPDLKTSDGNEQGDDGGWSFRAGRVFTSLLLADEINRATPKTQSAMLEVMAERQVTPPGDTHSYYLKYDRYNDEVVPLKSSDAESRPTDLPFMVLATQNPIDHEGTYTLPEAQIDRFMFKVLMPMPGRDTLAKIIARQASSDYALADARRPDVAYERRRDALKNVQATPYLEQHILNLIHASNGQIDQLDYDGRFGRDQKKRLEPLVELFDFGFGPRAAFMLMLAAKGWFAFFSREDSGTQAPANDAGIADLMAVVVPTLRHRLHLKFDWQEAYRQTPDESRRPDPAGRTRDDELRTRLIGDLCLYTAPHPEHRNLVKGALGDMQKRRR